MNASVLRTILLDLLLILKIIKLMKTISETNLNAYIANDEINKAIAAADEKTRYKRVHLAKLILRKSPMHKLKINVPLIAFVKQAGDKLAVKVLTMGKVVLLNDTDISSLSEIPGEFTLGGVTYGIKDTINGFPRYKVKRVEKN